MPTIRLSILACLLAGSVNAADLPSALSDADFTPVDLAEAELGRLLFWDPILSGNLNISCGTCHHPRFGTGDGLPLGVGEGGVGLGPERRADPNNPPEQRIPRNSPALFNLGARAFTVLFHDGRVEVDDTRPSQMRTPMDDDMLTGFSGVLSAQTMFPVLSSDEMAGHYSENDVSSAVRKGLITGPGGAWDILSARVSQMPEYSEAFQAVYPEIAKGRAIAFTDISNAIAVFIAHEWRSDTAPFDAVLRGQTTLEGAAADGIELFYGAAGCASCHSGPFLTDHSFHAMGQPQFGPGKAARFESHARDDGRMRVTGQSADAFAFRTPSLRNVALTAPYGHTGAYPTLAGFMRQHVDPARPQDIDAPALPPDIGAKDDLAPLSDEPHQASIRAAVTTTPVTLRDSELDAITAFLGTLTDPIAMTGRLGIPDKVPSGLPIDK